MNLNTAVHGQGFTDRLMTEREVHETVTALLGPAGLAGKKVLLIVPDNTRTAPVGLLFKAIHAAIGKATARLDVMVALGTHPALDEAAICRRLEITKAQREADYSKVSFFNHTWDQPETLQTVGHIAADEVGSLSDGLFAMDVLVDINRRVFDYDLLLIVGPVFPHEVVGFSGGNKYLFPGIGGPELLNFFHWLAAVITNPKIIGNKNTPVRQVVERAAAMVPIPTLAFCMVVHQHHLAGLYAGPPHAAWSKAADLSAWLHIETKAAPFHTVLSCAPAMYDDLWVGGKCMYKLEPVVADGGELIIYAPHIKEVSVTHGRLIETIGYHTRDYFLKQWDEFKDQPWSILAHSSHVRGIGSFDNGVERPRVRVTVASRISRERCHAINLGYRDPSSIDISEFANREEEGVLLVPRAGETLFRLEHPPAWARSERTGIMKDER